MLSFIFIAGQLDKQAVKTSFKIKFHMILSQKTVKFVILCKPIAFLARIVFKKQNLTKIELWHGYRMVV